MIESFILAAALAQPCVIPPKPVQHHAHPKTPVATLLQSCVTPPVPMCFRPPEQPIPDEIVLPPLPYYPSAADVPPPSSPPVDDLMLYGGGPWPPVGGGGGLVVGAGGSPIVPAVSPPPSIWIPPREPGGGGGFVHVPEIDSRSGVMAGPVLVLALLILVDTRRAGL